MLSEFMKKLSTLNDTKCPRCGGRGVIDDAEPGDVRFNEYKCPECDGKGFIENAKS